MPKVITVTTYIVVISSKASVFVDVISKSALEYDNVRRERGGRAQAPSPHGETAEKREREEGYKSPAADHNHKIKCRCYDFIPARARTRRQTAM